LQEFPGHSLTTRQRLELFVGLRNTIASHDRLHRFSQDFPGCADIGSDRLLIDLQLVQPFER
jgi:hypothetical protein